MCQIKTHVLRYWEGQFPQLKPSKRRGRRYYQRQDVLLILEINHLLNYHRFTVEGAIAKLNEKPAAETNPTASAGPKNQITTQSPTAVSQTDMDLMGLVGSLQHVMKQCQQFQTKIKDEL